MQHRTGIWQEHGHNGHVFSTWWKRVVWLWHGNSDKNEILRIVQRRKKQREFYTKLMGWPCSRQELQRQIVNLLLLLAALMLVFSLME